MSLLYSHVIRVFMVAVNLRHQWEKTNNLNMLMVWSAVLCAVLNLTWKTACKYNYKIMLIRIMENYGNFLSITYIYKTIFYFNEIRISIFLWLSVLCAVKLTADKI
jgi:hypothetical protein